MTLVLFSEIKLLTGPGKLHAAHAPIPDQTLEVPLGASLHGVLKAAMVAEGYRFEDLTYVAEQAPKTEQTPDERGEDMRRRLLKAYAAAVENRRTPAAHAIHALLTANASLDLGFIHKHMDL